MIRTTPCHCRDCGAAVDVKMFYSFVPGGTEEQRERAYNNAHSEAWEWLEHQANDLGYSGARACGRSGGWAAPFWYDSSLKGRSTAYTFEQDDTGRKFKAFARRAERACLRLVRNYARYLKQEMRE